MPDLGKDVGDGIGGLGSCALNLALVAILALSTLMVLLA